MTLAVSIGLGLLIGVSLGALGGGGSILTVPALVYVVGQDARAATTSSLFIVGISALIGSLGHARSGRVRWDVGVIFGLTGIAASFAGTALNRLVDPNVLLLAFAGVVLVAAAGMFGKSRAPDRNRELVTAGGAAAGPPPPEDAGAGTTRRWDRGRVGKVLAAGLAVGFMTGFFGVGGGFVIVPALTLALGLAMPEAVATSLVVIAINSGGALLARAGTAHFDWAVIVPFTLAAIAGSLTGKKVADRLSAKSLTRAFAVLLVAVAVYTATSSIIGLLG
ncbi:MAG: sulfite exporter TauE/SafE family protein [Blastococcus sp.]